MAFKNILYDNYENNIYENILGNDINEETEIYRIFSYKRFIETFVNKQLTLVHPSKFEDPFENIFLSSSFNINNQSKPIPFTGADYYYIQCWSSWKESDALWRIYSHDKQGIKVKTTISKILKYFYDKSNIISILSTHIGEVEYWSQAQILNPNCTIGLFRIISSTQTIKSVLIKRTEFEHEKEVRLIFRVPGNEFYNLYQNKGIYQFRIDPIDLFDEIVLDPRCDDLFLNNVINEINKHGYNNPIIKSSLYNKPNIIYNL